MTTFDDDFNLTRFSTVGNALTEVHSGARIFYNSASIGNGNGLDTSPNGSGSPPRKTARLDGDLDHSASISRARAKGKGKGKGRAADDLRDATNDGERDGPILLVVEDLGDMTIPEAYIERCFKQIHTAIGNILHRQPYQWSFQEVYQATRTAVLSSGRGLRIFERLRYELKETASDIASKLLALNERSDPIAWIQELVDAANWFDGSVSLLGKLLTYLDCSCLLEKGQSVRLTASDMFQVHVLTNYGIDARMQKGIRAWAHWERRERESHPKRPTIISLVGILISYHIFEDSFLKFYLQDITEFYSEESTRLAGAPQTDAQAASPIKRERKQSIKAETGGLGRSPQEFVEHCTNRIDEEKIRAQTVMGAFERCVLPIVQTVERTLLEGRLEWLSQGVVHALDQRSKPALAQIYTLFSRVDGLKVLCDAFKAHLQTIVESIVTDKAHEDEMVERLMELKRFLDDAVQTAFIDASDLPIKSEPQDGPSTSNSTTTSRVPTTPHHRKQPSTSGPSITPKHFATATNDAFTAGFKARRRVPAEMIAKCLDRAMRKGQEEASDEAFERMLSGALGLYRFTQDKDVFRRFYHTALAKRLLTQRSASDDFEKLVLKKLKDQYDSEFSMGDHMFHDLELSRELTEAFHAKPGIEDTTAANLTVMVLQRSFWPFSARAAGKGDVILPPTMQADLSKFTIFYKANHSGRKLDYDHSYGTAVVKARFDAGSKDLSVSLYQAVVLLLFNDADSLTYEEIKGLTGMEDGELRRTLQSLACGTKRVLRKEPAGKDVKDSDSFLFNAAFTDKRQRVHINTIVVRETPEESQRTHSAIEGDRKHYLDAAIVRVMKARKTFEHSLLVIETVKAVNAHFVPDVRMIKERIEQLIEQEYIRRDEEKENVYVYVA